jgi:hypothetical protein
MLEPFQRYRALTPEARRLFWRAVVLLPLVGASLHLRNFKKTQIWLQQRLAAWNSTLAEPPNAAEPADVAERVDVASRMVRAAAHYGMSGATCLEQSLTLWYLLGRQGISSSVRIGVRTAQGKFEAHAWVEHNGVALDELQNVHQHYTAFDREFSDLPGESQ